MKFSVVIPAHNDQESLHQTVDSFLRQTLRPHEIIVVDDGSDEPLHSYDSVLTFRIDREPGERGSSEAKNVGVGYASGDWIVFSDDDIVHEPDALESIAAKIGLLDRRDVLVNVFSVMPDVAPDAKRVAAILNNLSVYSEQHCGVISKDYFLKLGGYDAESFAAWGYNNQDLSLRVVRSGGLVTSNVVSVRTGDLLRCTHTRPSVHDAVKAKQDFIRKYGHQFDINMLMEDRRAAS